MNRLFLVTIGCIALTICLLKTGTIDFDDSVRGALRTTMWNVKYLYQSFGKTARTLTHRTDNEAVVVQFEGVTQKEEQSEATPLEQEKKKPKTVSEALKGFSSQMKAAVTELGKQFLQRETLNIINTSDFNPDRFQKTFVIDSTRSLAEERVLHKFLDNELSSGNRLDNIASAQARLFGEKHIATRDALRIGVALNGAGYRGMILGLGYAAGLAEMGIWDSATHVAASSGATWFLSVLMAIVQKHKGIQARQACAQVLEHFLAKIQNNTFSLTSAETIKAFLSQASLEAFVMSVLAPKVFFEQPIRSVDFYGGLLSWTLLSGIIDNPHQRCLSDEWELGDALKTGRFPFPVRAAVALEDNGYRWYEFNPLEVRDSRLNMAVWTSGFGRKYRQGASQIVAPEKKKMIDEFQPGKSTEEKLIGEYGPEERLEFLMGLWGSAYTTDAAGLKARIKADIEGRKIEWKQTDKSWDNLKRKAIADLKDKLILAVLKKLEDDKRIDIAGKRISPGQVNNFLLQCGDNYCPFPQEHVTPKPTPRPVSSELSDPEFTTMVDASLNFDVPLPVLFQERRNFDVIIVGDAASDLTLDAHYSKFFAYLREKDGIEYERTDDKKDSTLSIWKPKDGKKAPVIISVNFKRDDKRVEQAKKDATLKKFFDEYGLSTFDHTIALNTYAANFSFDYTAEQCKQLYGIGAFNMRAHEKVILDVLRDKLKSKRPAGHDDSDIVFGGDDEDVPHHEEPVRDPEEHKDESPESAAALLDALVGLAQKLGELKEALR